jgi:hypothetical protein
MSVFINAVIVTVLWLASFFLSRWLLIETGCTYWATVLFSWWFVAYFTKEINTTPIALVVTYIVLSVAIMTNYATGSAYQLFPTIPGAWSSDIWISFMMLAFMMMTPLIFNLIIRYTAKAFGYVV